MHSQWAAGGACSPLAPLDLWEKLAAFVSLPRVYRVRAEETGAQEREIAPRRVWAMPFAHV